MKTYASLITLAVLLIMYVVGVAGHLSSAFYSLMLKLTPWILLSFALVTLGQTVLSSGRTALQKRRILLWVLITWIMTYTLEVLGVKTGLVFGEYSYGGTLGPQLFNVPLIIGLNWVIIVYGLAESLRTVRSSLLLSLVLVPAGAVFFDFFLEPVAMSQLDYWSWAGNTVPLHNYIAWAVISFVFAVLYFWMVPSEPSRGPAMRFASGAPLSEHQSANTDPGLLAGTKFAQGVGVREASAADPSPLDRIRARTERFFPGLYVIIQFLFILALNLMLPLLGTL